MYFALRRKCAIIIFDPNCQFKQVGLIVYDLEELQDALDDGIEIVVYQPSSTNVQQSWDEFAEVMWPKGNYVLIIDEAHNIQKPNYVNPWLDKFTRQAPTDADAPYTVHIIETMHRPQDACGLVLSQATHYVFFRTTHPRDLDVIEERCGLEVREAVQQIDGRVFVLYDVDSEKYNIIQDSNSWYVNLRNPNERSKQNAGTDGRRKESGEKKGTESITP
jgi:hypothetical protein